MKFFKHSLVSLFLLLTSVSCNENDFLKEKPLDFYSPENSMETTAHFQTSVNYLYNRVRFIIWNMAADSRFALLYATDFAFCANAYYVPGKLNDYTNVMVPTFAVPLDVWKNCYTIITNANVILNRLEQSQSITENDKKTIRGETLFFRAFAYRFLANLYGGVPLVLQEISEPRRDYVRATRDEVYLQVKDDLEEAESLLADIDKVKDGKISRQAVEHLLSEVYICLGLFDEAIQTAGKVIDYPAMGLMNARFGSRLDEEGDVYSDLFRLDNQNRSSGNKESLWVLQHDYLNPGSSNHNMPWALLPTYWNIQISEDDGNGKIVKTTAFMGMTDRKGGHSQAWMQPTNYFFNELWDRGSENDMRNSEYNIIRDLQIDNPQSPAFGKWFVKDGYYKQADSVRQWYPLITKVARMGNLPEEYYDKDANGDPKITPFGEHIVTSAASLTLKDEYMFRLAETYLLRAEAYLGKGDQINAAADINIVRARANAEPVQPSDVDIDYILDERLRELYVEELRMLTLCRMGKLVDRNRKYNPATGKTIQDYHNLWPIPFSEIERNIYSEISQNPGY